MSDSIKIHLMICPISKIEALAIDDQRITEDKCCGTWNITKSFNVKVSVLEEILKKIKEPYEEVRPNEWISVEDRLPDKNQKVLGLMDCGEMCLTQYSKSWRRGCGAMLKSSYGFLGNDCEITHWMNIILPKKVEDE